MIHVTRPRRSPKILREKGGKAERALCSAYSAGERTFEIDSSICGALSVKERLKKAQHNKCCFCESCGDHTDWGTVEHLRPKGAWKQGKGKPLQKPGYYWLAYRWKNLLFACRCCNTFKGNLYPLQNPRERALCHRDSLTPEQPLLIDPTRQNPTQHIAFRGPLAVPRNGSKEGRATIDAMHLNRPPLWEKRKARMAQIQSLLDALKLLRPATGDEVVGADKRQFIENTDRQLRRFALDDAEYTALARAVLPSCYLPGR